MLLPYAVIATQPYMLALILIYLFFLFLLISWEFRIISYCFQYAVIVLCSFFLLYTSKICIQCSANHYIPLMFINVIQMLECLLCHNTLCYHHLFLVGFVLQIYQVIIVVLEIIMYVYLLLSHFSY